MGAWHVQRSRLLQRLEAAEERLLILLSAPAGYGKTSLVADWLSSTSHPPTAWVTIEDGDEGFWQGLAAALESLGVETSAQAFSHTGPELDRRTLVSLASLVAGQDERLRVVIDCADLVSGAVGRDLDFLLRHSGRRLQLVLLARSDPLLPLYRYRLDATIAELRARDLAFTDDEAAELFSSLGVALHRSSTEALNARTEGWAVGLRFAGTLLQERADTEAAVAEVVGDTGNIAEYLIAEVLDTQTPEIRQLLLNISVTDLVLPGLDAELGGRSASRDLSLLTRENAFVEPVPGHPGCYRLHPLFRDLLRATSSFEAPQELERLHRVAAGWFSDQGDVGEAVGQLVAIQAWEEAARCVVVDHALGTMLLPGSSRLLRSRLANMPRATRGPMVTLVRAALCLVEGEEAQGAQQLDRARQALDSSLGQAEESADVALVALDALRGRNDGARPAAELADQAAATLAAAGGGVEPDLALDALVGASKGIAAIRSDDLAGAEQAFAEVATAARGSGSLLASEAEGFLALLSCFRGRLTEAAARAKRSVAAADRIGVAAEERPNAGVLALAWVAVEQCDLPAAMGHAEQAARAHFLGGDPVTRAVLAVVRSRIEVARGHLTTAAAVVQDARARSSDDWDRDLLCLEAARIALAAGNHALARDHLSSASGSGGAEQVLLEARLDLARGAVPEVDEGEAMLHSSTALHLQVEGLLMLASVRLHNGSTDHARVAVERALRLAAGEHLRRPFHQAAPEVRELLSREAGLLARHQWLGPDRRSSPTRRAAIGSPVPEGAVPVLEKLTPKELEVLGHLAELLTTEEIASAMFVSVNTVRTHVRSILRKLGVPRRNAAVRRARELELIAR